MNFIRKVYSILACQLSITTAFIILVQTSSATNDFVQANPGLYITCAIFSIVFCIMIVCCFGRTAPVNMVLLFLFTICESYMVGGLTSFYPRDIVCVAGAATALTTTALTIYAMRTKTSIEVFAAMAFVVYFAMFPLIIISLFVGLGALYTLYCALGVLLFSLYLIIDTMIICKGSSMNGYRCSMDDYVIGAMMLYMDIIMLFIYILRLLGSK